MDRRGGCGRAVAGSQLLAAGQELTGLSVRSENSPTGQAAQRGLLLTAQAGCCCEPQGQGRLLQVEAKGPVCPAAG